MPRLWTERGKSPRCNCVGHILQPLITRFTGVVSQAEPGLGTGRLWGGRSRSGWQRDITGVALSFCCLFGTSPLAHTAPSAPAPCQGVPPSPSAKGRAGGHGWGACSRGRSGTSAAWPSAAGACGSQRAAVHRGGAPGTRRAARIPEPHNGSQ